MGFDLLGFQIWPLTLGNILLSIFFFSNCLLNLIPRLFGSAEKEEEGEGKEGGRGEA